MEVAREVQIDLLHRQHLGIAASGSTALDAEAWTERGLTQGDDSLLPDFVQSQGQADADGGLADARLCRADGRHEDEAALAHLVLVDEPYRHLCHIASVGLYVLGGYAQPGGNLVDVLQLALSRNLYVCFHLAFFLLVS